MRSARENPESPANQQATRENAAEVKRLQMEASDSFPAMVKRAGTSVVEALQAGGHVGLDIDADTAEPIDWIRIMHDEVGNMMIEARFDLSDPETVKAIRTRLARLVAFAQAWEQQIN